MTNPDNKVGCNAAFSGRTSPNAFNDYLQTFSGRGLISGWACVPSSGMTVALGATDGVRDVAIVEDDMGNFMTLNNRTTVAITTTLADADAENPRIDAIVGYVDNPPEVLEDSPTVDNPTICGLIPVAGTPAAEPVAPDDAAIRTAITADGGSGTAAYYVVLATVGVAAGATEITESDITAGEGAFVNYGIEPGENIQINGRVISATDTTYTNGNGLVLSGNTFSVDTAVVALNSYVDGQVSTLNDRIDETAVGTFETYTIPVADWAPLAGQYPFAYSANATATYTIGSDTIVELINDQAALFANYGFAIGAVSGQTVTFYAIDSPVDPVTLKVNYKEGA